MDAFKELLPYVLTFIATISTGALAYKGSRKSGEEDALTKAAGLHSDYAERMEKRVIALEEKGEKAALKQFATDAELRATNKRLDDVVEENEKYRDLISQVIIWITELLEWETKGRKPPAPMVTLSMVLSYLTSAIDRHQKDRESGQGYNQEGTTS